MFSLIDSDKLQGVIRTPIAQVLPNQRACSGSVLTLPSAYPCEQRGSLQIKQNEFSLLSCSIGAHLNINSEAKQ